MFKRFRKQPAPQVPEAPPPEPAPPPRARGFVPPPPRATELTSDDPRIARLQKRRQKLEDAIALVEHSADPDSPFQQRLSVLNATLDTIEDDIRAATPLDRRELPSLPSTPIEQVAVSLEPVPSVEFSIGSARFQYEEEIDWAERGTSVVIGDLVPRTVEIDPVIPDSISAPLRQELAAHLDRSAFAFATELRDRTIEGNALPSNATLADLAIPCPRCGSWQLWGGLCPRCIEHEVRLRNLGIERAKVLDERSREMDEWQRKMEELPIQRKRLAQTIADLESLRS